MAKGVAVGNYRGGTKRKRPGVHSKSKLSKLKSSKKYKKLNVGQGK